MTLYLGLPRPTLAGGVEGTCSAAFQAARRWRAAATSLKEQRSQQRSVGRQGRRRHKSPRLPCRLEGGATSGRQGRRYTPLIAHR
ncbi:MAG TPA: hypothetical protein VH599_04460 [Ktedonobacterales bacterium]